MRGLQPVWVPISQQRSCLIINTFSELTNTAATHVVPELKLAVNSGGKECRRGGNDTVPW